MTCFESRQPVLWQPVLQTLGTICSCDGACMHACMCPKSVRLTICMLKLHFTTHGYIASYIYCLLNSLSSDQVSAVNLEQLKSLVL